MKRALYFSFKDYQESLVEKLEEELNKILNEANNEDNDNNNDNQSTDFFENIYLQIILFKNESLEDLKDFKQKVEKGGIMIESFISNDQNNTFRKCPHCGQIFT